MKTVANAAWILVFAAGIAFSQQGKAGSGKPNRIVFQRYLDQTEDAFLVLVPKGWITRGGILRINPITALGGPAQSIEAKIDFAIMRESSGQLFIRWLPAIKYAQPSPYNSMVGGNWGGMPVVAMQTPQNYLTRIVFPQLHPPARNLKVLEVKQRPDVSAAVRQLPVARTMLSKGAPYHVDAETVTATYDEGMTRFKEILFTAIEGYNIAGISLWSNPFTVAARAPEGEYEAQNPIARIIFNSFVLNPLWLEAEMQGQIHRGRVVKRTLEEIARIDAEIARNRAKTMSSINEQQYLTLTAQQPFVNPHTGREELGSNEWKYRWENTWGELIYTDDAYWDPNADPELKVSGFKRCAIRPPK